jgi:thiol-disulfide isomerase/thioredoxin
MKTRTAQMKTTAILVWAVLLLSKISFAQQEATIKAVKIGDPAPAFAFNKLLNYPKSALKLTDFKGKILILDFWSTGCVSCIDSWPKLLKLQEQYKDKIQIVLVNSLQDEKMISPLLKRWEKNFGQKMNLPIAYGEKAIESLFPHQTVPHVVWIDPQGMVKYISGGSYLNAETIQGMLDGKAMRIYEKTDQYMEDIKFSKPLFVNGNGGTGDQVVYSSVISKYVPGIMGTRFFNNKKNYSAGALTNASLVRMFRDLFGRGVDKYGTQLLYPYARIILKTADTASLVSFVNGVFSFDNLHTIQFLSQKKMSEDKIKQRMIADLELYFQVKTAGARQKMKALVISRSSSAVTTYTEGKRMVSTANSRVALNKVTFQEFLNQLLSNTQHWYEFPYPVVDETGITAELGNISFDTDFSNYRLMSKQLEKHGFKFTIEEREVDVLVISDDK